MAEKKVDTLTAGRDKNLEIAISQIEKQFGKGSIMRMGDSKTALGDVPVVSTGSLGLDIALGIGGLPAGRIVEIYGPESSGKTTLCLHVIANAQAKGGNCAIIDAEHAIDPGYAASIGVKVDELLISQPDCGETDPNPDSSAPGRFSSQTGSRIFRRYETPFVYHPCAPGTIRHPHHG